MNLDIIQCTELIVCGLNLLGLGNLFGDRIFEKIKKEEILMDFLNNYNPETEYLLTFPPLNYNKIRIWRRGLRLLSEEEFMEETIYAQLLVEWFTKHPVREQKPFHSQSKTRH